MSEHESGAAGGQVQDVVRLRPAPKPENVEALCPKCGEPFVTSKETFGRHVQCPRGCGFVFIAGAI